ncbi:Hypothetical predicted protein [Prunus dulcis]|uniref:Uncharacterized protein n=1 Tax=Prunus dulcis TaxID=3755 RepID=A0A5E4EY74_PRUDU|nr:Hypothetical predicted protein [Prunus dulcis]
MHGPSSPSSIYYAPISKSSGNYKAVTCERLDNRLTGFHVRRGQSEEGLDRATRDSLTPSKFRTTSTYDLCASPFRFRGVTLLTDNWPLPSITL